MKVARINTSVSLIFCFNTSPWSSPWRSTGTHSCCPTSLPAASRTVTVPLRQGEPGEPADSEPALHLQGSRKTLCICLYQRLPPCFFTKKWYYHSGISSSTYKTRTHHPDTVGFPCTAGLLCRVCVRTTMVLLRLQSALLILWQNKKNIFFWLSPTINQSTAIQPEKIKAILKFKDLSQECSKMNPIDSGCQWSSWRRDAPSLQMSSKQLIGCPKGGTCRTSHGERAKGNKGWAWGWSRA